MLDDSFAAGQAALQIGDWLAAKTHFERAIQTEDIPEVRDGLGIALWWLNDISGAHQQRIHAYNAFKSRGNRAHAALIAAWIAREQVFLHSNASAMTGWFARAQRL